MNLAQVLEVFFPTPRICPICNEKQPELQVCAKCLEKIKELENTYGKCSRCGTFGLESVTCENCSYWPDYFKSNISVVPYENEYRKLLHRFKFQSQGWLSTPMAKLMARKIKEKNLAIDFIIPVPSHPKRVRERGFNQALLLAKGVARELSLECKHNILFRRVNTSHQTGKNKRDRCRNIKEAFSVCSREKIMNKTVLLIDDVITSGATLRECSKVLHQNGARFIYGSTWAAGVKI